MFIKFYFEMHMSKQRLLDVTIKEFVKCVRLHCSFILLNPSFCVLFAFQIVDVVYSV